MFLSLFSSDIHKIETFIGPAVTFIVAIVVAKLLNVVLHRYIRRSSHILHVDPTNYSFLQNAVSFVVFVGAAFFIFWNIPELHTLGKTLFAGAGIAAAILGFASQEAFSNIISGIFIVIYKPFSVGDNIKLLSNSQGGTVEDITLRHTILLADGNRRMVVPNSVISREQILNSSIKDPRIQLFFEMLITYDSNHNLAMNIMKEDALKHPLYADFRSVKEKMEGVEPVQTMILALEAKGVRLRATIWTKNEGDAFNLKCDLLKILKERYEKEGINIAHDDNVMLLKEK